MSETILKIENLSKQYRLGTVGTGTISHDLNRWWSKIRGKEDPYLKVGESNDKSIKVKSQYVWALKDINFEVKKGEVLGIIGKNGAGKSTLLKILSKITGPTTGSIKSKGRIASLLEVGTGFHPEMTGKENIFLNGAILGMTKKEITEKLDKIVKFSGCERYINTPVKRYSSGMKVRLAFSVAAHLEPDILVVDEVLAVGDAEFQKKAIGKIQDISKIDGRTVLFVSHDMVAIQNLCSKTLLLKNGKFFCLEKTSITISKYMQLNTGNKVEKGVVSLDFIEKRKHSKNLNLNNLKIFDTKLGFGNKIKAFGNGFFEINFKSHNKILKNNIQVAITIKDLFNRPQLTFSTTFRKKILKKEKKDSIKCTFSDINLIPGIYIIHIWLLNDYEDEVIIENACEIEIVDNDIFNSGILPSLKFHGPILTTNFKWE